MQISRGEQRGQCRNAAKYFAKNRTHHVGAWFFRSSAEFGQEAIQLGDGRFHVLGFLARAQR